MPKYLISYRKTEGAGQKPDWASFTTAERGLAGGARDPRARRASA